MQAKKGKISNKEAKIIKQVLGKEETMHHKRKEVLITEGVLLALPLLITFALYINLVLKTATSVYDVTERLSPMNAEPLMLFMLFFIIIYSIFLIFMYRKLKNELMLTMKAERGSKKLA